MGQWLKLRDSLAHERKIVPASRRALSCRALAYGLIAALLCGLGGASPARATPGDILVVRADRTPLYNLPDTAATRVMSLAQGHKLIEFERRGDWVRVGIFGTLGKEAWVPAAALAPEARKASGGALDGGKAEEKADEEPGDAPAFHLAISGSPAMKFAAECQVIEASGNLRRRVLAGLVPARFTFRASALLCRVRKRDSLGRLRVRLSRRGEPLAQAETAAPFNHVRVQSDGPWGKAAGIRGAIPTRRWEPGGQTGRDPVPRLPGQVVPRLPGQIVPPLNGANRR